MSDSVNPYQPPSAASDAPARPSSQLRLRLMRLLAGCCGAVALCALLGLGWIIWQVPRQSMGFSIVYYPVFAVLFGAMAHYLWRRAGVSGSATRRSLR